MTQEFITYAGDRRPILDLSRSGLERTCEVIAAALLILQYVMFLSSWTNLPDAVPSHFGASGSPNSWGSKYTLLILPGVSTFVYILLTVLAHIPHRYNYLVRITVENAEIQYTLARTFLTILKTEVIAIFMYIQWVAIRVALGQRTGFGVLFMPVALVVLFGSIAMYVVLSLKNRKGG